MRFEVEYRIAEQTAFCFEKKQKFSKFEFQNLAFTIYEVGTR